MKVKTIITILVLGFIPFSSLAGNPGEKKTDSLARSYHELYLKSVSAGEKEDALRSLKLYNRYNDSLESIRRAAERKGFEARYNNEEKAKQLDLLKKQEEINRIRLNQSRIALYAFSGAVILIPLLLLLIFRQKSLKA